MEAKYPVDLTGMAENEESRKKVFPNNFKNDFFRLIRVLSAKKPGHMTDKEIKRGSRRLPTTFMVAGLANSYNKRIVMTKTLAARRVKVPIATRSRVFYREDF